MGALDGIRILDLGWAMAGPQATRILADFGAEVIKVESRARLDMARTIFGPHVGDQAPDNSGYFNNFNRNKLGDHAEHGQAGGARDLRAAGRDLRRRAGELQRRRDAELGVRLRRTSARSARTSST